jgi:hypothetical protein
VPRRDGPDVAEFELLGTDGSTSVDRSAAVDMTAYTTMCARFAAAVRTWEAHELDVQRGLHVQRVIESADTALFMER